VISLLRRVTRFRFALGFAGAAVLLLMASPAAHATTGQPPSGATSASSRIVEAGWLIPDDYAPSDSTVNERTKNYISGTMMRTLNRWGDASNGFHTKYDGFIGSQLADMAQRNWNQGSAMAFGNWAMTVTSEFTQFAVNLDIINGLGAAMDGIAKTMLSALIGVTGGAGAGVLFGVIAILSVLLAIWRNSRGGLARMAREVGAVIAVIAVVFGIGITTLNYNPGQGDTYKPAPVSPGWFVKGVNDSITSLTALPAKTFVDGIEGAVWGNELRDSTLGGGLGCSKYTAAMSASFERGISATTTSSKSQVAIAQVTDSLWDSTGLYVWAKTQGGYQNPYAAKVYCRILDFRNGSSPRSNASMTYLAALNSGYGATATSLSNAITTDANLRAPFAPSSSENTTASIVAWAACKPTGFSGGRFSWAWEADWVGFKGGTGNMGFEMTGSNANDECQKWWEATSPTDSSGKATGGQDVPDIFDVKGDAGWISEHTATAAGTTQVRDFLNALTGVNPWGGTLGVVSYAGGAAMTMGAFAFIDVVVIIAKLFAAMFIIALWFVLIGAMFRPSEMKDRLGKTVNKFLGTAVFAALTTLILTFVVIFTRALIRIGIDIWGGGSIGSMLWSGLAPVLALVLVHIMFTKVFKLPSPVSLRGAQAWSKSGMSGALGAGVGAGVGSFMGTRLGSMAKGAAVRAGNAAVNAGLSKVSGGRLGGASGTRSAMAPSGSKPAGLSEELSARVDAGEQLTRKEQKTVDKTLAGLQADKTKRDWTLANEAAEDQKRLDAADLRSARREYRQEAGVAAPGDIAGAIAAGASGLAASVGAGARRAGVIVSDKTGLTALRSELGSRRAIRREAIAARRAGAAEQKTMREGMAAKGAASLAAANASAAAALTGAEAAAKRALWGASAVAGTASSAGAKLSAAAANGAAASQAVSMMGGSGGGAALAGAIAAGLGSGGGGASTTSPGSRAASSPIMVTDRSAPAAVTDVITPQVEATPVVQKRDVIVAAAGASHVRRVGGPVARVDVPAGTMVGDVRTVAPVRATAVGEPQVRVSASQIAKGGQPAGVSGRPTPVARGASIADAQSAVTPAVRRAASVINAPANAAHAARQQAWKAHDAAGEKVQQVVNTRTVQAALNDARVTRAAVGVGVDAVKGSAAYRGAEKAAQRAAATIAKGAARAAAGAQALSERKANNAAVLASYRSKRAALADAQQLAEDVVQHSGGAVRMKDEGNTPGSAQAKDEG